MGRVDVRAIRRRQILDVAAQLAAQRGWAATTIADICAQLGVSTRVLTYHFANKDDLVFAALEDTLARFRAHFEPLFEDDTPFAGKIERYLCAIGHAAHRDPDLPLLLLQFMTYSLCQPEATRRIRALLRETRARGAERLAAAAARDGVVLADPAATMYTVMAFSWGAFLSGALMGDEDVPNTVSAEAARLFRLALANDGALVGPTRR